MGTAITTTLNKDKMKHVILYFLERINNYHLGRTKLMKLLYYVDFDNFQHYGASITGAKYRKLPLGPVPDEAEAVIDDMAANKEVEQLKSTTISGTKKYTQHRLIALDAKFNRSLFSGVEMETIERVAKLWEYANATEMKLASHKEAPWAATEDGKAIDYEMAHYRSPICDSEDVDELLSESEEFSKFVSTLK